MDVTVPVLAVAAVPSMLLMAALVSVMAAVVATRGVRPPMACPAPMGRAFRYVRRIAHIEIALAERGKNGSGDLATVVGEEHVAAKAPAAGKTKSHSKPKKKAVAKKFAGKKTAGKR